MNPERIIQTKPSRQACIATLLARHAVKSQSELAELLTAEGIETTQATLSRDLVEMRAQKVRNSSGQLIYAIPEEGVAGAVRGAMAPQEIAALEARFARLALDLVITVEAARNLVVIRTPAGAAQYLASALDQSLYGGTLGTVAGDDTVLVITRDEQHADEFVDSVHQITSGRRG